MDRLRGLPRASGFWVEVVRGATGGAAVQALSLAVSLALSVILARSLGASGFGVYAYALAVLNILLIFSEVGVPALLVREVAASGAVGNWSLMRGALVRGLQAVLSVSLGLLLIGLAALLAFQARLGPEIFWTALAMLVALPLTAVAKTLAHAVRGLHSVVWAQASELLLRPLFVLLLVVGLLAADPRLLAPPVAAAAHVLAAAAVVLIAGWRLMAVLPAGVRQVRPTEARSRWLRSLLPFALIGSAMVVNTQADIVMLGWFRPASDVGVYRIAAQASFLTLFVIQASQNVLAPMFGRMYGQADDTELRRQFRQVSGLIFLATLPIALGLIVFGESLVTLAFGDAYAAASLPLAVLAVGYLVNIGFGPVGALLQMFGRERVTARVLLGTVVLNVLLNAALIPPYGVLGGALATATSVIVYHAALRWVAYRDLGV